MFLYIMRHGPAEERAATGRDADRALTFRGREVVARAAEELRRLRAAPVTRIVASPLARAIETAEIVRAIAAGTETAISIHPGLIPADEAPVGLLDELAAGDIDVVVVSHQPTTETMVRHLGPELATGPSAAPLAAGFRTGMIVALTRGSRRDEAGGAAGFAWRLEAVVDPHVLPHDRAR